MNPINDKQSNTKKPPRRFVSRKEFEDVKLDARNANTGIQYALIRFVNLENRLKAVEAEKDKCRFSGAVCGGCLVISALVNIATFFVC